MEAKSNNQKTMEKLASPRELQSATGEELSVLLPSCLDKVKGMSRQASLDTLMIYYHEVDRLSDPA